MGLGDFLGGVKDAAVNVGKGVGWVADPHHWDDIAEGAGNAVEFVTEHPGQAWDTAFEVGRAVVKDQMDPMNLAINAGLLAATVATGGLAAPALAAKVGLGAKSVQAGVTAAKGIDAVADVAKGVSTTSKALKAGQTALKTADTVGDTAKTGSRLMRGVDKALGLEPGKLGRGLSNAVNPIENSRWGVAAMREAGAQNLLKAGGQAPSTARQVGAALLQGGGRGAGMAKQLPGISDKVYAVQKMAARAEAVGKRAHQLDQFSQGVEIAADPMKAVEGQAAKQLDFRSAGYTDRGQTATSLYGDTSQTSLPSGSSSQVSSGSPVSRSQVSASMYANRPTDLNAQGAPANFAPEIPKSGMYAQSVGQAPAGSAFPTLSTPVTSAQPIGAVGPSKTSTGVIDVGAPSDRGFQFPEISQPSISPMYSQGSRTSRRNTGNLVGV